MDSAKVCFVGAGLGDPDLLTRKVERTLRNASAVIHDRFVSAQILCLINPEARVILLGSEGSQEERLADVCGWYLRLREDCRDVVRLTATDPLLGETDGDVGEELEFLARHRFEVEVLPGVLAETVYECRALVREAAATVQESGRALTR
jgi:uroporphyrin-III C-methyltransferase/precorrin-2 dehydrogenase/sirohydrochlorin ferrochelatase/uroporphyrin-III C-methyltransferase